MPSSSLSVYSCAADSASTKASLRQASRGLSNVVPRSRSQRGRRSRRRTRAPRNGTAARLQDLRGAKDVPSSTRLLLALLRIRIQKKGLWTGPFSRAHPNLTLEVLNRSDLTEHLSVSDYWISGGPPGVWAREIAEYSDVRKVDSLAEVGSGCLYRITFSSPPIVYVYRMLGLPMQFPVRIQAGFLTWEVVARRSEFEAVLKHARTVNPDFQVVSIRDRPLRSHLPMLTDAQQHILADAMAAGYFAVPRGITLTDLARRLGRSKSGLSEAIANIERKLLESALRPTSLTP